MDSDSFSEGPKAALPYFVSEPRRPGIIAATGVRGIFIVLAKCCAIAALASVAGCADANASGNLQNRLELIDRSHGISRTVILLPGGGARVDILDQEHKRQVSCLIPVGPDEVNRLLRVASSIDPRTFTEPLHLKELYESEQTNYAMSWVTDGREDYISFCGQRFFKVVTGIVSEIQIVGCEELARSLYEKRLADEFLAAGDKESAVQYMNIATRDYDEWANKFDERHGIIREFMLTPYGIGKHHVLVPAGAGKELQDQLKARNGDDQAIELQQNIWQLITEETAVSWTGDTAVVSFNPDHWKMNLFGALSLSPDLITQLKSQTSSKIPSTGTMKQ